jgi:hypothetical protein
MGKVKKNDKEIEKNDKEDFDATKVLPNLKDIKNIQEEAENDAKKIEEEKPKVSDKTEVVPTITDEDLKKAEAVEGTTEVVEEVKEQKPAGAIRDRRRKKPSTAQPKVERTIPNKFKWGIFEGANMSVNEITEALNAQGITTEEQWNNRTDEEMERVLQCCGAI